MEIHEQDGMIFIVPVALYDKTYLDALCKEVEETKSKAASGNQAVFKEY